MCLNSNASLNDNSNDSLKNEIAFSQDRLGYYDCSIKYSHKITSNLWLKVGLIEIGGYRKNEPNKDFGGYTSTNRQLSVGLVLGLDKHSNTSLKGIDFVYGMDMRITYNGYKDSNDNPALPVEMRTHFYHDYRAGIGFTFGFYYNFSDKFAIGSQVNPYFVYLERVDENSSVNKVKGFEYDLFSNVSIISIKYRW